MGDARVSLKKLIKSVATPIENEERYTGETSLLNGANNFYKGGRSRFYQGRLWYNNRATPHPGQVSGTEDSLALGFIQNEEYIDPTRTQSSNLKKNAFDLYDSKSIQYLC
jgi:hypothetical protein